MPEVSGCGVFRPYFSVTLNPLSFTPELKEHLKVLKVFMLYPSCLLSSHNDINLISVVQKQPISRKLAEVLFQTLS